MDRESPSKVSTDIDEIDLRELARTIWAGRTIIIALTVVSALCSIAYALTRVEIYRAEALLAPAELQQSSNPLISQLGGAAALVGINAGRPGDNQIISTLAILQSREFLKEFLADHNLVPSLFDSVLSSDGDSSIEDGTGQPSQSRGDTPSDWDAFRKFSGILSVIEEGTTGLVRIAIEWPNPEEASRWVNLIVSDINNHIKERDVEEARSAITYLQSQLASTQLVEMQRVFYQLIESQTRIIMLADSRDEYVFRVIDPAVVPDRIISPNRKLICTLGTTTGFLLSLLIVAMRQAIFKR